MNIFSVKYVQASYHILIYCCAKAITKYETMRTTMFSKVAKLSD